MMEGQFGYNLLLQSMPFASRGIAMNVQDDLYQSQHYYGPAVEKNQMQPPVPLTLPPWINFQQTHQCHNGFSAESNVPEIQREVPYNEHETAPGFYLADSSIGMHVSKGKRSSASHSRVPAGAPLCPRKQRSLLSKQRAIVADRSRRVRIAQGLDALHKLVPHHNKGRKESIYDEIIEHIKYLQLQIRDLSQSRLGGEPISNSFIFLEGYGHFLVHELMMTNEPLEEMMGKLLEVNPLAAMQLLKSKGLFIMPTSLSEGLHQFM